jgi:hypothetical protein
MQSTSECLYIYYSIFDPSSLSLDWDFASYYDSQVLVIYLMFRIHPTHSDPSWVNVRRGCKHAGGPATRTQMYCCVGPLIRSNLQGASALRCFNRLHIGLDSVPLVTAWLAHPGKQKGNKETLCLCPHLVPTYFDCIGNCVPDAFNTSEIRCVGHCPPCEHDSDSYKKTNHHPQLLSECAHPRLSRQST